MLFSHLFTPSARTRAAFLSGLPLFTVSPVGAPVGNRPGKRASPCLAGGTAHLRLWCDVGEGGLHPRRHVYHTGGPVPGLCPRRPDEDEQGEMRRAEKCHILVRCG